MKILLPLIKKERNSSRLQEGGKKLLSRSHNLNLVGLQRLPRLVSLKKKKKNKIKGLQTHSLDFYFSRSQTLPGASATHKHTHTNTIIKQKKSLIINIYKHTAFNHITWPFPPVICALM